MLKKNEEYVVNIIDNGFQGEGIAKIDGITVFIDNAIKGEKVKVKILKVQTNFAYGKIIEILENSVNRINKEDCTTFKKCGGCSLRHIKYQETLKDWFIGLCLVFFIHLIMSGVLMLTQKFTNT